MLQQTTLPFKKQSTDAASSKKATGEGKDRAANKRHTRLKEIADSTLRAIEGGSVNFNGVVVDLDAKVRFSTHNTRYYPPDDATLSAWATPSSASTVATRPEVSVLEISTLEGARLLHDKLSSSSLSSGHGRIALLNFASATRPGGGFLSGAQAQEESIARSSTLYPSLTSAAAKAFYDLHKKDRGGGFYHHAMVYSPGVLVLRDDGGAWVAPFEVDVLTSAAVNAGDVRTKNSKRADPTDAAALEGRIEARMRERMARILCLFEQQGAKNIVLGGFGTGVFRNEVETVCSIWRELLTGPRFKHSFDRVVFAVLGTTTYQTFKRRLG